MVGFCQFGSLSEFQDFKTILLVYLHWSIQWCRYWLQTCLLILRKNQSDRWIPQEGFDWMEMITRWNADIELDLEQSHQEGPYLEMKFSKCCRFLGFDLWKNRYWIFREPEWRSVRDLESLRLYKSFLSWTGWWENRIVYFTLALCWTEIITKSKNWRWLVTSWSIGWSSILDGTRFYGS